MKTFNIIQEVIDYSVINPSETVEYKEYYDDGQPRYHCFFVGGKKHGEYKSYHSNGSFRCHFFYVNGKHHGEYKSYLSNGQLHMHCFYVNDEELYIDHLLDGSYKSLCILSTLFDGNIIDADI